MSDREPGLGLAAALFLAVGLTIGGGVFVFTGLVLKIAGPALPWCYLLAVGPVGLLMLPLAALGSALPTTGGSYRYPSRMVSPGLAFVGIWVFALASFFGQIPLYAVSCAQYAQLIWPALDPTLGAVGIVTVFYLVNLLGLRLAVQLEAVMVVVLVGALAFLTVRGLGRVELARLAQATAAGPGAIGLGVALLSFTYLGANGLLELGGELRDAGRTLPRAMLGALPLVAALYLGLAVVTVGAADWRAVVDREQPLIGVARQLTGPAGVALFVLGGAVLALLTTLHGLFMVGPRALLRMSDDGLLPGWLGHHGARLATPHRLLTGIWLLSLVGLASGLPLEVLASYAALGGMGLLVPLLISARRLPARFPAAHAAAPLRLGPRTLGPCVGAGLLVVALFAVVILVDLRTPARILPFGGFVVSGALCYRWRARWLMARGIDVRQLLGERP